MISIEEKILLAKEVGMDKWAAKRDISLMIAMKFKPITMDEIVNKIAPYAYYSIYSPFSFTYEKPKWWNRSIFGPTHIKAKTIKQIETMDLKDWTDNLPYGALLSVKEAKECGISHFKIHFPVTPERARIKQDPVITGIIGRIEKLKRWLNGVDCPFPHGNAAYEIGIHSHTEVIYEGDLLEIFSWDDGKIYD